MKKPLVMSFENREGLTEGGLSLLREGDAVLIKASHGLRLDLIAPIVLKEN